MTTTAKIKGETLVVSLPILRLVGLVAGVVVPTVLFFNWMFWIYSEHRFDERYAKKGDVLTHQLADERYVSSLVFKEFKDDYKAYLARSERKQEDFQRDVISLLQGRR